MTGIIISLFILMLIIVFPIMFLMDETQKKLDKIIERIDSCLPDNSYDEHCVKPLNKYTTFRVVPWGHGWDVEYRNPADTMWKVCGFEKTEDDAKVAMNDIIDQIKKGKI